MKTLNLIIILVSLFFFSEKSFSQFDLLNEHKSLYAKNKVKTVNKTLLDNSEKKLYSVTFVNQLGQITQENIYNTKSGDLISKSIITYPDKLKALESYLFLPDSSEFQTEYTYNSSGQLIQMIYENNISTFEYVPKDNTIHHTFTQGSDNSYHFFYIYNSDNLLSTYRFDEGETKYFYNSDNLLTHSKTYGHNMTSDETFFEYFDNELISKETNIFYEEDTVSLKLIYEYSYEFYK